jgi:hypothetical protein
MNNQARGQWIDPTPGLSKKYRETNFIRKKSEGKLARQVLVKKAMDGKTPPSTQDLARRFMVSIETIKSDLKAIGAFDFKK